MLQIHQWIAQCQWTYGQHKCDSMDYKEKKSNKKEKNIKLAGVVGVKFGGIIGESVADWTWSKYFVCMHKILKYLIKFYI